MTCKIVAALCITLTAGSCFSQLTPAQKQAEADDPHSLNYVPPLARMEPQAKKLAAKAIEEYNNTDKYKYQKQHDEYTLMTVFCRQLLLQKLSRVYCANPKLHDKEHIEDIRGNAYFYVSELQMVQRVLGKLPSALQNDPYLPTEEGAGAARKYLSCGK
jgi:hypothetical protein